MNLEAILRARSGEKCELCEATTPLNIYEVPPQTYTNEENCVLICDKCRNQIDKKEFLDKQHWNCLTTSMWNEAPVVQVVSWRMLNRLRDESWAADSIEMMYVEEEKLAWAKATGDHESDGPDFDTGTP